jgi:hypothetical protein
MFYCNTPKSRQFPRPVINRVRVAAKIELAKLDNKASLTPAEAARHAILVGYLSR